MTKYFYLFGGVIIGSVFTYYYLKNDEKYSEFYSLNYEDIQNDNKHSHNVTGQRMTEQSMTEQCDPHKIEPVIN
jgi:hypothetical protein